MGSMALKTRLALTGIVALGVSLLAGWYWIAAGTLVAYVVWTWVRIPLERRTRHAREGWEYH